MSNSTSPTLQNDGLYSLPVSADGRPASIGNSGADIEELPAYMIEWSTRSRRLKFLNDVQELQAELAPENHDRLNDSFKRLFIVHGLPTDYVIPLQSCLAVDPLFINAQAQRRRYYPLRRMPGDRWVSFEYPELCTKVGKISQGTVIDVEKAYKAGHDPLPDPPSYPLTGGTDVVVFCRASLWMNGDNDGGECFCIGTLEHVLSAE